MIGILVFVKSEHYLYFKTKKMEVFSQIRRTLFPRLLAVALLAVSWSRAESRLPVPVGLTRCVTSSNCGTGQCCRGSDGRTLVTDHQDPSNIWPLFRTASGGTCVAGHAGRRERCDSSCSCGPGYQCFRPLTGVCCAPRTCHSDQEVEELERQYACGYLPMRRRRSPLFRRRDCKFPPKSRPTPTIPLMKNKY